jgi:hypothetical protein
LVTALVTPGAWLQWHVLGEAQGQWEWKEEACLFRRAAPVALQKEEQEQSCDVGWMEELGVKQMR